MFQLARTSIVLLGLVAGTVSTAHADIEWKETVVHNTTSSVSVQVTEDTLICSAADYGALFLKLLVPELAKITLLDHQNSGAGAPCVAAGLCEEGNLPTDIIDPENPTQLVDINVQAVRIDEIDSVAMTCKTSLREQVALTVRGIGFTHERWAQLGSRPYSDCVAPPSDDRPADYIGPGASEPKAGGCAAGGTNGGFLMMVIGALAGGLLAMRRRRVLA
jgi:uncharacterized protein (TIGR03382 family)